MATSKYLTLSLLVALTAVLAAGQDQPAASSPAAPRGPSNTLSATCVVRITVDPTVLPLNEETVNSLIRSPSVLLKAARDVLSLNTPEDFYRVLNPPDPARSLVTIRWLSTSSALRSSAAESSPREEMMRQLEQAYGPGYTRQMRVSPNEEKKGEAKGGEAGDSSQKDSRPGPGQEGRSGSFGMGFGAGGGMGGMGMGSGTLQAQEQSPEVRRLPGESDVAYRTRLAQVRAQQAVKSPGMGGMGGYGGGGGMGFAYGAPAAPEPEAGVMQSATIELQVNLVNLSDALPPRADEFLGAVVTNLRDSLLRAYDSYRRDVDQALFQAKSSYQFVESRLDSTTGAISPATVVIRKQLDQVVELTGLTPQTPVREAFELLRSAGASQNPPLNIVVLWNDLGEHLSIDPASPVSVDGLRSAKLGTMLDLLVKGLPAGDAKPLWKIKDDVIVVGTTATLGQTQESAAGAHVETDARNLGGQRSELARKAQTLELDLAGLEARQKAIQEQIWKTQEAAKKRLAEDPVTQEFDRLLRTSEENLRNLKKALEAGQAAVVDLTRAEASVASVRIDLARRQEELIRQFGGGQLEEFTKELGRVAIDQAEKEAQLQIVRRQLDEVQKQLMQALTFDPEAIRLRLAQETLDSAGRRVAELQMCLANLQPPTVIVIGSN